MKWTIYRGTGTDKGKPLHESLTEYDGKGNVVYQDTFEYVGKWMGECYLTVSIKSAYPIDFQIGDYIEYRGERFTINYDPTVIKKARRGTYGEGFVYDNIKFNSYSNELTMMRFRDWVLDDNKVHYTSLPTFTFYAKDVDDLVDRLQACADRWCKDNGRDKSEYWMFYTLANNTQGTKDAGQYQTTYDRTVQRARDISTDSDFLSAVQSEWTKTYGDPSDYKDSRDDERYDRNISISNNTVWDGLQKVKTEFGLNFIIRGRNVYIGTVGIPTSHLFEYGKGKGLYEVDKTADTDQKVVTRLHAYGSSENLPTRYYAELNVQPFGVIEKVRNSSNKDVCTNYEPGSIDYVACFEIDIPYRVDMFKTPTYYDWIGQKRADIAGYVIKFHLEGSTDILTGVVACNQGMKYSDNNNKCQIIVKYNKEGEVTQTDWGTPSQSALKTFSAAISQGKKIIFDAGIKDDAVPAENKYYNTDNLPNNMAVNSLMLPGFPLNALSEICRSEYDETTKSTNYYITNPSTKKEVLFHNESGKHLITFSSDRHDPYIVSQNAASLGYRDGDISCTESNDDNGLEAVYPTIEDVTTSDAGLDSNSTRLDAIDSADTIDDNGVYDKDSTTIKGFHVTLPKLGFDLRQAAKDANSSGEFQLSMKDGFCGGRTFTAQVSEVDGTTGKIKLSVKRVYDDALDLWFPYSYAKSVKTPGTDMTNAYQIMPGDHFVLAGIYVSDVNYVWTASVRLLRKAIHWLCKNDYTRYVYTPKIDEIFMARQDLEAKSDTSGKTASIHDTLKEGDMLLFDDDDLLISGSVYIDQLTIKENGNNGIPTYEVTLRNEVNVGTIQRIQNKVDSVANDIRTGNIGGNGGVSPTTFDPLVKSYGEKYFLSKTHDDSTPHKLTMGEAEVTGDATVDGNATVGGDASVKGNATVGGDASVKGNSTVDKDLDVNGDAKIAGSTTTHNLTVTGTAHFFELQVDKITAGSGGRIMSAADGFTVADVGAMEGGRVKVYWLAQDSNGRAVMNMWRVNDQAICMSFNLGQLDETGKGQMVANKYYWCLVTAVSGMTPETRTVNGVEGKYNWIELSTQTKAEGCTVNPAVGDDIAQLGYEGTDDETRQCATYESSYVSIDPDLKPPFRAVYCGISDFNLSSHRDSYKDAHSGIFNGTLKILDKRPDVLTLTQAHNGLVTQTTPDVVEISIKDGYGRNVMSLYTLSVERDSGDAQADALWNMDHKNVKFPLSISYSDLSTMGLAQSIFFTVKAVSEIRGKLSASVYEKLDSTRKFYISFTSNRRVVYDDDVDMAITAHIMYGDDDYTDHFLADSRTTWTWTRDSGVEAEDNAWKPTIGASNNILLVEHHFNSNTSRMDCGSKWAERLHVLFHLEAKICLDSMPSGTSVVVPGTTGIGSNV